MGGLAFRLLLLPFLAPVATTAVNPALRALASLNLQIFPTFQPEEANNYSIYYFDQKVIGVGSSRSHNPSTGSAVLRGQTPEPTLKPRLLNA